MKLFILFGIISLTHSVPDTTSVAKNYCSMSYLCPPGTKSVACPYTSNLNMGCQGKMMPVDRELILSAHNRYRQKIAAGEYAPQFKSAVNMAEMVYNEDLEMLASYNARSCNYGHDRCRSTDEFPYAGQNIASYAIIGADVENPNTHIKDLIDSWFDEYKECDMRQINFLHESDKLIGHFTQMVHYKADKIGCAVNLFTKDDGWNTLYLVCDYAYSNVQYEPVYIPGPPGAACSRRSTKYPALCAP